MRHIKIGALTLVAMFMMSGVASAVESEGELVNSAKEALKLKHFTGKSGTVTIETTGGVKITCPSSTSEGEINTRLEGKEELTLSGGCEDGTTKTKCGESGKSGEGKFIFSLLIRLLRAVVGSLVLLAMNFANGKDTIECGLEKLELKGGFLTALTKEQEKKLSKKYTFTAKQTKGIQEFTKFENQAKEKVEIKLTLGGVQAGQSLGEEVTFEEEAQFV